MRQKVMGKTRDEWERVEMSLRRVGFLVYQVREAAKVSGNTDMEKKAGADFDAVVAAAALIQGVVIEGEEWGAPEKPVQ